MVDVEAGESEEMNVKGADFIDFGTACLAIRLRAWHWTLTIGGTAKARWWARNTRSPARPPHCYQ